MGLRAVFATDLHLEKPQNFLPENWNVIETQLKPLRQIVEYARSQGINTVIIGGDIFETPYPAQKTILALVQFLVEHPWITFYIILGNHDFSEVGEHSLEIVEFLTKVQSYNNVEIIDKSTKTKKIDKVQVCFLPHPYTHPPKTKKPKINVAHFGIKGAVGDNGIKLKEGVELDPEHDFWFLGHLHRYQKYKRAVYPGSLVQLNFGEPLPKGFIDFEAYYTKKNGQKRLKVDWDWHKIDTPYELYNKKIHHLNDLEDLEYSEHQLYKLFVKKTLQLPTDLFDRFPNILKTTPFGNKKELQALQRESIPLEDQQTHTIEPTYQLVNYLVEEKNLSKKQARKGRRIVKNIIKQLNNAGTSETSETQETQ